MTAVQQARTLVCELVNLFTLEVPAAYARIGGHLPAGRVHLLTARLPDLTGGAGSITSELDHYRPVHGVPPERPRVGPDPLEREAWFREMPR